MAGDPKFEPSQDLPDFPYARYAALLGLDGHPHRPPGRDRRRPGTRRWPPTGPFVLEAVTDPNVPPLPPHIGLDDAKALATALAHGDPDGKAVVRESVRQKLADIFGSR